MDVPYYGYIYRVNLPKNRVYIGMHKYTHYEVGQLDEKYFGSGKILKDIYKKYGYPDPLFLENNITIDYLDNAYDRFWLEYLEKLYIQEARNNAEIICINIADGGDGGPTGYHPHPQTSKSIEKRKQTMLKRYGGFPPAWNKGLTKETDEGVRKNASAKIGRPRSAETKQKLKISNSIASKKMWRNRTPAQRKEISEKLSKLKWFNNGEINVRKLKCPEGFKKGRIWK